MLGFNVLNNNVFWDVREDIPPWGLISATQKVEVGLQRVEVKEEFNRMLDLNLQFELCDPG